MLRASARGYPHGVTGDGDHGMYSEYAVRHVMGDLDERASQVFRAHLLECSECRARVGELRTIASELAEVERAERRERVAHALETKEREDDDDGEEEEPAGRPWTGRLAALLALGLIALLAVWNFTLRSTNDQLRSALTAEQRASSIINFGERWETLETAAGVNGAARSRGRDVAIMIEGTDDERTYVVIFYDADGAELRTSTEPSVDGRVRLLTQFPAGTTRVDVLAPATSADSTGRSGTLLFRAQP